MLDWSWRGPGMRRTAWFHSQTMGTTASAATRATCQRMKLVHAGSSNRGGPCHSVSTGSCWLQMPAAASAAATRAKVSAGLSVRRQPSRLNSAPLPRL